MSSDEEYIPAADSHEPAFTSNGGSIFPNARHFTVAGGTFTITNITHYSVAPPAVQPGLRMIPREDIDPQQDLSVGRHSGVIRSRHEYERKCVRRVYSARLDSEGRTSAVTVTVYKGDGAEEEWRRDVANYVSKFATALDATRKRSEKLEKEKESTFSSSDHNLESPAARMAVAELAGQVLNQTYERVNDVMREQLGALQGTVNELMSQQQTPLQSQDGQRVAALTHENAKEKALNAQLKARIQDLEAAKHRTHASSGVNSTEALEKENKELKAMNQELMNRLCENSSSVGEAAALRSNFDLWQQNTNLAQRCAQLEKDATAAGTPGLQLSYDMLKKQYVELEQKLKANSVFHLFSALPPQAVALPQQQKELQWQKDERQHKAKLRKRLAELEKGLAAGRATQPPPAAKASGFETPTGARGRRYCDVQAQARRRRGDAVAS